MGYSFNATRTCSFAYSICYLLFNACKGEKFIKNVILLKDIDFAEIENHLPSEWNIISSNSDILQFSDFYTSKIKQIKFIRSLNADRFILSIYKNDYLKWSIIFKIFLFFTNSREKFLLDTDGKLEKITFFSLLKNILLSLFSFLYQLIYLFKIPFIFIKFRKKSNVKISKVNDLKNIKGIYIRTNDSYNLVAGGSLGHTLGILNGFKENCSSITFFGNDYINGIDKSIKQVIINPSSFFNYVNISNRTIFSEFFVKKIKKKVKEINPHFIYQRLSRDDFSGALLSKLYKIPLIVEYNSSMRWELMNSSLFVEKFFVGLTEMLEKIMLNQASLIVVVSEVLKKELINKNYDQEKIKVIPNGVDLSIFKPKSSDKLKEKLKIKNNIVVGFSGTFGFWHGIDVLEKAIKLINKSNIECYFLMIGDGYYRKKMENEFLNSNNLIFTKKIPYSEMVEYLSLCDIFVSPHSLNNEKAFIGSPTKLFEYMAMEKVIIASDLDQISDIINPALNVELINKSFKINSFNDDAVGIKFNQGDYNQLAFAIQYAVENYKSLQHLGKNARIKAKLNYQWNNLTSLIMKTLFQKNEF